MRSALWLAVGIVLGASAPAIAQTFLPMGNMGSGVADWRSTCSKPMFDLDAKRGGARDAQIDFSMYQDCLKRQADNDAQYAAQSVYEGAKKELRAVEDDASIWGFTIQ